MRVLNKNCNSCCTQLQVSIALLSNIEYILNHKKKNVITNEDLPYKKQIEYCKPFWGLYVCREITNEI
jgi:homospermidine synthase